MSHSSAGAGIKSGLALGVDVGGTKIAAGIVDTASGALTAREEIPTQAERGGLAVLDDVCALCVRMLQAAPAPIEHIGVGICELVDPTGAVQSSQTVAWQGLPVRETLRDVVPHAVVESDVRAHAVAEAWFGAGADYALFTFITVGTGISSCIVQNRVPLTGAHGNALVLATAPLEIPVADSELNARDLDSREGDAVASDTNAGDGQPVPVRSFVLEEYASGLALLQRYAAATGETLAHGRSLFQRAAEGDAHACRILAGAGAALGNSLAFLVNIIDPQAVIVGGGLGLAGGLYWTHMEAGMRRAIYAENSRQVPLLPAQLGADAGIIGAAMAAYAQNRPTDRAHATQG